MKLKIKKYKNIEDVTFEVVNNTLILVGKNSVGKSNVINAISEGCYEIKESSHKFEDVLLVSSEPTSLDYDVTTNLTKLFNKIYKIDNQGFIDEYYKIIDEANYKLAEDFTFSETINEFKLAVSSDPNNIQNSILKPEILIDGVNVGLDIGSGLKRRIAYQLLRRLTMNGNQEKYVILVDTPELHSHPAMIRVICSELKKLAEQGHLIIVTTHNESVIEYLHTDIKQIAKLNKESGKLFSTQIPLNFYMEKVYDFYQEKNIFKLPNGKYNISLAHIIKEDLSSFCKTILRDKTLKIFFADTIVIGEGASEEILFDYIFTKENEMLIQKNVDYLTAFGKFYLPFFFILANLYQVKVVCMYDVDKKENSSHAAFHRAFCKYAKANKTDIEMIGLDPDLESEIGLDMPSHRIEKPLQIFNAIASEPDKIEKISSRLIKSIEKISN